MEFLRDKAANAFDLGIRRDAGEDPLSPSPKPVGHKYILDALYHQTFDGHSDKKAGAFGPGSGLSSYWHPHPPEKALGQGKGFE
jgi:hypothetical protein